MQKHEELLLALLAATVNHDTNRCCALLPVDTGCWERVLTLAEKHGVTGLVFSCMELLPQSCHPEKTVLLKLFGNAEYTDLLPRMGLIEEEDEGECCICKRQTFFKDINTKKYVCSNECKSKL